MGRSLKQGRGKGSTQQEEIEKYEVDLCFCGPKKPRHPYRWFLDFQYVQSKTGKKQGPHSAFNDAARW